MLPAAPIDRDADGMPDGFEQPQAGLGLEPMTFDVNGSQLSLPFTGVAGCTRLACCLNRLADELAGVGSARVFAHGLEDG
jgi:hypothetical protein